MTLAQTYPGVRVLDLSTNLAGPFCAMILGDMGADVVKIERPPAGDDTRSLPPALDGQSTVFASVNRNKRSVLLDLKSAEGRQSLLRLVASSDVLVESFPPGLAASLQLTYTDLRVCNPRLVVCSISAFGDGPLGRHMPGYDALVQAVSGLMSMTGHPGAPPVRMGPSVLDLTTGLWGCLGVMAALQRRQTSGQGDHVRPSLIDTAFNTIGHQLAGYLATGKPPRKLGSGAPSAAPYGVYRAIDGELLIATASEPQFQRLCVALGLENLAQDPRFATMPLRLANRDELDSLVGQVVAQDTVDHWLATLETARIPVGRVNDLPAALDLPVVVERQLLKSLSADGSEAPGLPLLRLPIDPEGTAVWRRPPLLGEHTAEVLSALAGKADG